LSSFNFICSSAAVGHNPTEITVAEDSALAPISRCGGRSKLMYEVMAARAHGPRPIDKFQTDLRKLERKR
jgi:UDP-glucose 4-epimerase